MERKGSCFIQTLEIYPDQRPSMYSEDECGICYQTYNAGRRCPRQLHCQHSFCERCLLALSRALGAEEAGSRAIVCPLCRHSTSMSGDGTLRAELRVDEGVLERLVASGVLEEEDEEEDMDVQDTEESRDHCETPPEDSDLSAGSRGGRTPGPWRKLWRKICGKSSRRRGGDSFMTNEDLRDFVMMSCNMF